MIRRLRFAVRVAALDSGLACSWSAPFWRFARRVLRA